MTKCVFLKYYSGLKTKKQQQKYSIFLGFISICMILNQHGVGGCCKFLPCLLQYSDPINVPLVQADPDPFSHLDQIGPIESLSWDKYDSLFQFD